MTIKVTYNVTDVYVTQDVSPVYINVSYSSGGGSGAAVWGGITGTLSDQTDLQTALDGKFDDPTGTSLQYIDGTGALQTFPLTLPVLQQVRNQTGGTLAVGTVVYISGATGNLPTVTKAIATGDATSAQTLGMVSASIANNGTGYVVVIGTCSGLDTSAFTEGQQLYLSYTTAGAVTTTKPYAPNHLVYVGIVTRAHPTLGTVEVRVQNGYELDEIHDVDALNPNNNDGLFYNSTTSLWEHKQISTALGYTPANAATTLTINGVTYDLSTSRTWTISAGISGSGASGQVSYWDGTSSISGENNLFWDAANNRLGIGTITPTDNLDVNGTSIFRSTGTFDNSALGVNNYVSIKSADNRESGFNIASVSGVRWQFFVDSYAANNFYIFNFRTNVAALSIRGSSSNVVINSTSDTGQKLQVNGTTLLNGNVTFSSATGMFWDATNSRLGIGTNSPSLPFHLEGNGYINGKLGIGTTTLTTNTLRITRVQTGATGINTVLSSGQINSDVTASVNNFTSQLITQAATFTLGSYSHFRATDALKGAGSTINNDFGFNVDDLTFGVNNFGFYGNVSSGANKWNLYMNGTANNYLSGNLAIGSTSNTTDWLNIAASTTAKAHIYLAAGVAPTSPVNGDIWFDGTDVKMRIGGLTKTFTLV